MIKFIRICGHDFNVRNIIAIRPRLWQGQTSIDVVTTKETYMYDVREHISVAHAAIAEALNEINSTLKVVVEVDLTERKR